tara:strand:- start:132 stop:506 length:375 start_codon:yes stop_codon:yes gene_type:complete
MKLLTLLYVFCLFYVLIPGNIIKLPIKTSKMNIIIIHGLLFTVILSCTYNLVENVKLIEGMDHLPKKNETDMNQNMGKENDQENEDKNQDGMEEMENEDIYSPSQDADKPASKKDPLGPVMNPY